MKKLILTALTVFIGIVSTAQVDRSKVPDPQPNPEIKFDIPDAVTTPNGMKVIVVENHKLPQVSFQLYVDYPTFREGDKAGLGGIFGELLSSGTESYSKDEFDAKVDYMGANIFTSQRGFFASSLKKHTPQLLELLSEIVTKPTFPQDEFDRIITTNLSGLMSQKSDPSAMANNVAAVVNYGKDHPYGEIVTEKTLNNLTVDDVKDYYAKNFIPNHAYLVIVGDVTQEEAKGYVEKYFSAWEKKENLEQETFEYPEYKGNNVYFVDKAGAVQSQIVLTHTVNLQPGHPDALKLRLMNQIMGGGSFSAHMMKNLREDKAYTYGCYSSISSDRLVGSFTASGSFRNEVTDSSVVQLLYEIKWMTENLVTDAELSLVKASMTGAFARSLEQPRTTARFALNTVRFGLPKDYYQTYLTELEAITKEDILATAKKYLQPENLNIIIVGNQEIADKQKVFDTGDGMEFKDYEGKEAIMLKPVGPGVTAESIFKKYVYKRLSVSNKEDYDKKMKKLGYVQKTYKGHIAEAQSDFWIMSFAGTPNKQASMVKVTGAQTMVISKDHFNGESGSQFVIMQGKKKYEGDELESMKKPSFPFEQVHYLADADMTVEVQGIDEIDGKEYYKIKIQEKDAVGFTLEYYDVETGWLMMIEKFEEDAEGNLVGGKVLYEKYIDLKKGFMVPSTMTMINPGQPAIVMEFQSGKIGKKPKSKAFDGEFPK